MKKNLAWALLAALTLTACEKESDMSDNGPVELRLTSGIEVQTKTTHGLDQAFKQDEQIHVWVDNAETDAALYENNVLKQAADNALTGGTAMYFPQDGKGVDIYALHGIVTLTEKAPYPTAELAHTVASDQRSSTSTNGYAESDLAYARKIDVTRETPIVNLTFQHLLSKIEVVLKEGDGETGFLGNIDKVEILGTKPTANFTLDKATEVDAISVSAAGTETAIEIDADVTTDAPEILNEAIIVPQNIEKETPFIQITLTSGGVFTYKLKEGTTFDSGKKYKYIITANQTDLTLTATIEPWGDGIGDDEGAATM
ncbi:fimbrillin family protein [Parabacteroides sp.]